MQEGEGKEREKKAWEESEGEGEEGNEGARVYVQIVPRITYEHIIPCIALY